MTFFLTLMILQEPIESFTQKKCVLFISDKKNVVFHILNICTYV